MSMSQPFFPPLVQINCFFFLFPPSSSSFVLLPFFFPPSSSSVVLFWFVDLKEFRVQGERSTIWNDIFQDALELSEAVVEEKIAKYNRIKEIASDFVVCDSEFWQIYPFMH